MKALAIIPVLCLLSANLPAQTAEPEYNWYKDKEKNYHARFTVSMQVLQLFNEALRLDGEYRLKDTRHWLQLGLTAYLFTNDKVNPDSYNNGTYGWIRGDNYNAMTGYGVDFNYKYIILRCLYVAGGPTWHHYNFRYSGYEWRRFEEDGLQYHEHIQDVWKQTVNRIGFNATVGFQRISRHNFLFDIYGGISFRKGFHKEPDLRQFDSSIISYGYTGETFILGIRLGYAGKPKS